MVIVGRGFRRRETMAAQSVTQSAPPPRMRSKPNTFLENPKIPFAVALLFGDAVLVYLIIAFVPCKFDNPLTSSSSSANLNEM